MRIPILATLSAVLAACSGSNGTIKVSITDAPTDLANVSQVLITYDELRVHDDAATDRDVPAGGELDLKLDFNAASSINKTGSGTHVLTPVLTVLP